MGEDLIKDITNIKKMLQKCSDKETIYNLYNELCNLIATYEIQCGNSQKNLNKFKTHFKLLENNDELFDRENFEKEIKIIKRFKSDKKLYMNIYEYIINDIYNYFNNHEYNKSKKNKINFDAMDKLYLKFDLKYYQFYLQLKDHIIVSDLDDEAYEGYTFYAPHLSKSYAVVNDDFYTYSHELAHMYQNSKCENIGAINEAIEIYPTSVELIIGNIKNKNRTYKNKFLMYLMWCLEEIDELDLNCENEDIVNYNYQMIANIIGNLGSLHLYYTYLEDKKHYFECVDRLNNNINNIHSISDFNMFSDVNVGTKELIKKFIAS